MSNGTSYIMRILEEIQGADVEHFDQSTLGHVEDGETVVGKLDHSGQQLYMVVQRHERDLTALIERYRRQYTDPEQVSHDESVDMTRTVNRLRRELHIRELIFEETLRQEFGIVGDVAIEVRQDFQVVTFKKQGDAGGMPPFLSSLLGDLFGGGGVHFVRG